jgi:hypothetical protein
MSANENLASKNRTVKLVKYPKLQGRFANFQTFYDKL